MPAVLLFGSQSGTERLPRRVREPCYERVTELSSAEAEHGTLKHNQSPFSAKSATVISKKMSPLAM